MAKEDFLELLVQREVELVGVIQLDILLKEFVRRHTRDPERFTFDPNLPTSHCKTYVNGKEGFTCTE